MKKILWLVNIIIPKISNHLNLPVKSNGGWIEGMCNALLEQDDIELTIIFPNTSDIDGDIDNLKYYGFSNGNQTYFEKIIRKENPDIINIFGTEYAHTLEMTKACKNLGVSGKVVINIQGLVHYSGKYHYYAGLPNSTINSCTFRDIIKFNNIKKQKQQFEKRGKYEIEAIKNVSHIIGRTDWDKACTEQINPSAKYHFCNETLRDEFYKNEWGLENCEKHAIFLSQCSYPIKGFHHMLEAMLEILSRYPNAHIYTTGKNPLKLTGIDKIKQGSYSVYLGKLIKKYGLESKVTFLGLLDEKQMCERFLSSHVFVSASSIENSPNSLGEAMILGVPSISSYVGGVANLLEDKKDGFLYQNDAPYMISHYVCRIFDDDELAIKFSKNGKAHAKITHNKEFNLERILDIYREIW